MGILLAIDGMHIVRRIYEASDEPEPAQKAELAVRHALSSFRKLLAVHMPTHVLVAFDGEGPSWRHALHPAYKQQHEQMPAPLADALPRLHEQLQKMGMSTISISGAEADDVIATAVLRWLQEERGDAIIASTDKDLHSLIAQGARCWDHFRNEWHDAAWVECKFGVAASQLPDLLAMIGDATDGIPGVPKIGVKTAAKLLQSYGDIEHIMAGAGILKNTMGERLRQHADALRLSRKLVALKDDVRLGVTWNLLAYDSHQTD